MAPPSTAARSKPSGPVPSGALRRGLLHYALLRIGSAADALLDAIDWQPTAAEAPSTEADAFRQLREGLGPQADWVWPSPDSPTWFRPPHAEYATQLQRFRELWDDRESEILELHFGRMLEPAEIGYVMGLDAASIASVIERARQQAEATFGRTPPSRSSDMAGAILEAYAPGLGTRESLPSTPAEPLAVGAMVDQRYQVESYIGGGAHADVYRARDRYVHNHIVALKVARERVSSEAEQEHALREIRCLASVFHPSIAQLKDHGWLDGRLWMVMPLYEGETLAERLERGPLGREEATQIFVALAEGLSAIHAAGVRHQDVKPENVMLAELGRTGGGERPVLPVLIDFGVAVSGDERFLAGTPDYAAPEIAARAGGAEAPAPSDRSDVFSLALCLRDALSPECRAMTELSNESLETLLRRRATQPSELPPEKQLRDLDERFQRWLALDPEQRPTASAFADELDVLLEPERRRVRRRRRLRWGANAALISALIVASVAWNLHQRAETHRARAQVERERASQASRRAELAEGELEEESRLRQQLERRVQDLANSGYSREELLQQLAEAQGTIADLELDVRRQTIESNRLRRSNDQLEEAYRRLREDSAMRARPAARAAAPSAPAEAEPSAPEAPPAQVAAGTEATE
ncbi:MAG: protein kinase [Deltaproteobacteria bacterium]|nr:protein kinase [Deltaproteobacteria bacterium]